MAKTIAQMALSHAKKQEEEKIRKSQESVAELRQKALNCVSDLFTELISEKSEYYLNHAEPISFDFKEISEYGLDPDSILTVTFFEVLGFNVNKKSDFFELTVPIHEVGKKYTPAQRMYQNYERQIKKAITESEKLARTDCNLALQKLKEGDFESTCYPTYFSITVAICSSFDFNNSHYNFTVRDIMKKHNFLVHLLGPQRWELRVYKRHK